MPSLCGRVLQGSTGEGLNDVRVMIASSPCEMIDIAAVTWNDGRFELDLPVPGDYEILFVADGFRRATRRITITDRGCRVEVTLDAEEQA